MHKKVVFMGLMAFMFTLASAGVVQAFGRSGVTITRQPRDTVARAVTMCYRSAHRSPVFPECISEVPDQSGPVCGNGIVESGEACDGTAPEGYLCTSQCMLSRDSSNGNGQTDPVCGDLVVEGSEECDGSAPEGFMCSDQCMLQEDANSGSGNGSGDNGDGDNGSGDDGSIGAGTGEVVINELYIDVNKSDRGDDPMHEWVELYNTDTNPINLSGWMIEDSTQTVSVFEDGITLNPGEFALVSLDASTFTNYWSDVYDSNAKLVVLGTTIGNGLRDEGDRLLLKDASGAVIDTMSYGDDETIFSLPIPDNSQTLSRIAAGSDLDSADDWFINDEPTPGF